MANKYNTSFVPNNNNTKQEKSSKISNSTKRKIMSIVTLVSFVFFILSAVAAGYLFVRTNLLKSEMAEINRNINEVSENINDQTTQRITDLSQRIEIGGNLIDSHLASSELFIILEEYTLPSVRFSELTYSYGEESVTLSGSGEAAGFGSVVLQSSAYGQSDDMRDVIFSNLKTSTGGGEEEVNSAPPGSNVTFNFEAKLDKEAVLFRNVVDADGATIDNPVRRSTDGQVDNNQEQ